MNFEVTFGNFHDLLSRYPIPLAAALCSRLAEIGVRSTFFIIASIAALLFEKLDGQVEIISDESAANLSSDKTSKMSKGLDQWKSEYDIVCQFVDQINRCFGLFLFVTSVTDFSVTIIELQNIFLDFSNPRYYFQFIHAFLRIMFVYAIVHRVHSKVFLFFEAFSLGTIVAKKFFFKASGLSDTFRAVRSSDDDEFQFQVKLFLKLEIA